MPKETIRETARAMRRHVIDTMNLHGAHMRYGTVTNVGPLEIAVHGIDETLNEADGEVTLGDNARHRISLSDLQKNDSVLLTFVPEGDTGGGDWQVIDVNTDHTFAPPEAATPLPEQRHGRIVADGGATTYSAPHDLGATPGSAEGTAGSADAAAPFYVTAGSVNVIVHFLAAPPSGSDNVVVNWSVYE